MTIHVNNPWWMNGVQPHTDYRYDASWSQNPLCVMALHGGPPVREMHFKGSLLPKITFDIWLGCLEDQFEGMRLIMEDKNSAGIEVHYAAPRYSFRVHYDEDLAVSLTVHTNDSAVILQLQDFFRDMTSASSPPGRVHAIVAAKDGLMLKSLGTGGSALQRGNYEPDVLAGYDRICADLKSADPGGRIAIFDGRPGSGKTYCIKGILAEVPEVSFIVVPANLVHSLAEPQTLPLLIDFRKNNGHKPIVFVIEDADECLAPRMADNMSSVSAVLNLGDGILGQLLDVRIVATTNTHHHEIDEAIKRPGRLSCMVHVEFLTVPTANAIYARLTGKGGSFDRKATLAEVYRLAREDGWKPQALDRKVGFEPRLPPLSNDV